MSLELAGGGRRSGPLARALRAAGVFLLGVPRILAWALVCAWAGLIWLLSAGTVPQVEEPHWIWELVSNLAHAPLFGFLALFLTAVLVREEGGTWPVLRWARVVLVLALVVGYGLVDEWHQSHTPGREASPVDLLTDLTGASAVLWIVSYLGQRTASEVGLWLRLLWGTAACVASASLASLE